MELNLSWFLFGFGTCLVAVSPWLLIVHGRRG